MPVQLLDLLAQGRHLPGQAIDPLGGTPLLPLVLRGQRFQGLGQLRLERGHEPFLIAREPDRGPPADRPVRVEFRARRQHDVPATLPLEQPDPPGSYSPASPASLAETRSGPPAPPASGSGPTATAPAPSSRSRCPARERSRPSAAVSMGWPMVSWTGRGTVGETAPLRGAP